MTDSVTASPAPAGTASTTRALERSDARERQPAEEREPDDRDQDADEDGAVDLGGGRVLEPEGIAALAQADVERHGCAAPDAAVGQLRLAGRGLGRRGRAGRGGRGGGRHEPMVPRNRETAGRRGPSLTRPTSGRSPPPGHRRRPSSGRARSRRRHRPRASAPTSRAGPVTQGDSSRRLVGEPLALEPDEDALVLASPTARLERLQVERQVGLEVVVERGPAVTDPRRPVSPRPPSRPR